MTVGKITRLVVSVSIAAWVIWASLAVLLGGELDSISATVRDYSSQYPVIPWAVGFVMGHWWWPMRPAVKRDGRA